MEGTAAHLESTPEGVLRALLLERRQHNPRYSLRALARDLDLSHGFLSLAMSGKRKLSPYQTLRLAKIAGLNARDTASLIGVSADKRGSRAAVRPKDFMRVELDRFDVLTEPHHL